jgi:hypothetical protein
MEGDVYVRDGSVSCLVAKTGAVTRGDVTRGDDAADADVPAPTRAIAVAASAANVKAPRLRRTVPGSVRASLAMTPPPRNPPNHARPSGPNQ